MNLSQRKNFFTILGILSGTLGIAGLIVTHVTPQRSEALFTPKSVVTVLSLLLLLLCTGLTVQTFKHVRRPDQKIRILAISVLSTLVGSYFILILFVVLFQDQFIARNSIIFQPKPTSRETANVLARNNIEALDFVTADQTHLSGWLVRKGSKDKSPLIIFFGGSSQEVSTMIPYFQRLDGWSTAVVNYRGYGLSEGTPSEENLFRDAILVYDILSKREDIDPERIVAMGWSLGTGVAVYLSEQRPVRGTVLVTPFDSWGHMFQSRDFPLIPLSFIHDEYFIFNSLQRAPSVTSPVLCLVGAKDNIVLPFLSQSLVDAWSGEATMNVYENAGHGLLFQDNSSWKDVSQFLEALE